MNVIEVSSLDAERYYEITDDQLKEIIKLEPTEAGAYVRKNCKFAKISNNSDDVDFSFADNMDQPFTVPGEKRKKHKLPKKEWIEEWNEFIEGVNDYLQG